MTADASWDFPGMLCQNFWLQKVVYDTMCGAVVNPNGMQDRDARYMNAAVEFDIKSLRPTYKLQWGLAGASNALAVAAGLGFDARVVTAACKIAAQAMVSPCIARPPAPVPRYPASA